MTGGADAVVIDRSGAAFADRIDSLDWTRTGGELDASGCALLRGVLTPAECAALAGMYGTASGAASTSILLTRCRG